MNVKTRAQTVHKYICLFRWSYHLPQAWREISWLCPTTCSSTTIPNTVEEQKDWTPLKVSKQYALFFWGKTGEVSSKVIFACHIQAKLGQISMIYHSRANKGCGFYSKIIFSALNNGAFCQFLSIFTTQDRTNLSETYLFKLIF